MSGGPEFDRGHAGVYLFNAFLRKVELQKLFLWLALAGAGARLTQLLLVTGVLLSTRHLLHSLKVCICTCEVSL